MNENIITVRGKEYTINDTVEKLNEALEEIEKIDFRLQMRDVWTLETKEINNNNKRNEFIIKEWIKEKAN